MGVMATFKRTLTPALNPTGIGSSLAALYAAAVAVWNFSHHHAAVDPQVVFGAFTAAAFLYARFKVTPVADPKGADGKPLYPLTGDVTGVTTTTPGTAP